jgi:hypothetical protein
MVSRCNLFGVWSVAPPISNPPGVAVRPGFIGNALDTTGTHPKRQRTGALQNAVAHTPVPEGIVSSWDDSRVVATDEFVDDFIILGVVGDAAGG